MQFPTGPGPARPFPAGPIPSAPVPSGPVPVRPVAEGEVAPGLPGWPPGPGVVALPGGTVVRGSSLRRPRSRDEPADLTVYLTALPPRCAPSGRVWVPWPDFGVPVRWRQAAATLRSAHAATGRRRVEVVCGGGRGRTGTALACLAVCDGVAADEAVRFIREHYHPRAVETPWQRWFVRWFHDHRLDR